MAKVGKALESVLEGYASFLRERIEVSGPAVALKFPQRQVIIIHLSDIDSSERLVPQDRCQKPSRT